MPQAPNRSSKGHAEGHAEGHGRGPTNKGCCCKRSQCIKNYCDCYQSMVICSKLCRCVGCRNTQERKAVDLNTPAKNSSAAKREKAAAMSAKAAAAAAKAGIHIPTKAAGAGSRSGAAGKAMAVPVGLPPGQQAVSVPMNVVKKSPGTFNVQAGPHRLVQVGCGAREGMAIMSRSMPSGSASGGSAKPPVQPQPLAATAIPAEPKEHKELNFFLQPVNASLMECVLVQAIEAEHLGLNQIQVSQLVLEEYVRGMKAIYEVSCPENEITNQTK
ncbi:hypothetical protein KR009_009171 [Drosophila setifemur]|nr:hypothetical protein KR009_009171 [Drosophila setifemur]